MKHLRLFGFLLLAGSGVPGCGGLSTGRSSPAPVNLANQVSHISVDYVTTADPFKDASEAFDRGDYRWIEFGWYEILIERPPGPKPRGVIEVDGNPCVVTGDWKQDRQRLAAQTYARYYNLHMAYLLWIKHSRERAFDPPMTDESP